MLEAKESCKKSPDYRAKASILYTYTEPHSDGAFPKSDVQVYACVCVSAAHAGAIFGAYWPMAKDSSLSEETTPPAALYCSSNSLRVKAPPSGRSAADQYSRRRSHLRAPHKHGGWKRDYSLLSVCGNKTLKKRSSQRVFFALFLRSSPPLQRTFPSKRVYTVHRRFKVACSIIGPRFVFISSHAMALHIRRAIFQWHCTCARTL